MSAVSTDVAQIRNAVWADTVREAIADGIEQCYSDVSNPTLQTEALEAALQTKIDEGEMAALTIGDGEITTAKIADGAITQAKLSDDFLTGTEVKHLITGWQSGYIRTDQATTNMTPVASSSEQYVVVPASSGDKFTLTMTGSGYGRAWAFVDAEGNVLSMANSNAALTSEQITAPTDTDTLVLVDKSGNPTCYIDYYLKKRVSNLENDVSEISDDNAVRDTLIAKTAYHTLVYTGNVIDASGGATGSPTTIEVEFDDGVYYSNPFSTGNHEMRFYPVDQYGNAISMTRSTTQTTSTYFGTSTRIYVLTFSGLSIHYESFAILDNYELGGRADDCYYTLSETPHHWKVLIYGYSSGAAITMGLTKGLHSDQYLPYVAPTVGYYYVDEFDQHVTGLVDDIMDEVLVSSYNLIDTDYLTDAISGYYYTKSGYYMPVTPGKAITCNAISWVLTFYDSDYTQISTAGSPSPYVASIVPETAAWATFRMGVRNGDDFGLVIWETDTVQNALYERPIVRPNKKIAAKYLDSDIYNYAVPDSLSQGIMQMARFAAIRADNEKHDAYRFATFNIKANSGTSGFRNYGDTLFDFAVDFCGIQEINYTGQEFHAACRPFQFGYYAGDYVAEEGYTTILDNACVSRFEITETYNIRLFDSENGTSVYKILMPWHKHYPRRATLSVYNFHGRLQVADRLREVDAIIDAIAEDTSDFIIVMGDTNSEVDTAGHRQSWDKLVAAGLTPAHNGESPTWPTVENPDRYSSMDNFFFSSHISLMNYGISDWHVYHTTDHDLVWADLIFDFDAVLADTWEEPATVTAPSE